MLISLVLVFILICLFSMVLGVVQQHRWHFYEDCLNGSRGGNTGFEQLNR